MNVVSAELERSIRYYRWMQEHMEWEQAHAFPILQLVSSPASLGLILHLMRLSADERSRIVQLLVRSAHPFAAEKLGKPMRVDEARDIGTAQLQSLDFVDQMRARRQRSARADQPWNRNRLVKSLCAALDPFFNAPPQPISPVSWKYEVNLGDWVVRTQFELSSKIIDKAVYSHSLRRVDADPKTFAELASVNTFEMTRPDVVQRISKPHQTSCSLMHGAGFGPCTFDLLSQSDEDDMVKAVSIHLGRFWPALKKMVEGLGISD